MPKSKRKKIKPAKSWEKVKRLISRRVVELCKDAPEPRLATNIRLQVSQTLVPEDFPRTSGSHSDHLAFLVGSELSGEDVWMCGQDVQVIVTKNRYDIANEFRLDLTWNIAIPERDVQSILRIFETIFPKPGRSK